MAAVPPLAGVTVVAVEQAVAVPFATRQLADLGARVVKVERPGDGDFARHYDTTVKGLASYFVWVNRGKESLTLDLKHPAARAVLARLLDRADVFLQNLAPGAAERLGLDAATVRAGRPRLVVGDLSGYGGAGPYRDKKAYDLLVQCEAALLSVTGTPDHPVKAGISVADIAGGMYAYTGVLTALYARERSGQGSAFAVALFDALVEWMSQPVYYALYTGRPPERTGADHATIAPYGAFRTGDGRIVQLGIQNDREWRRFCAEVLERPGTADDPRFATNADRVAHRAALTALVEEVFGGLSAAAVVGRLEAAQVAYARANDVADLIDHPQLAARDRWTEVGSPAGPLRMLRPPVVSEELPYELGPVPAVGEHTDAILAELGLDAAALRAARAV